MSLAEAWHNCTPDQGPGPIPSTQAFSFLVGLNAVLIFATAATISWLLGLIGIGTAIITTIANWLGFIQSSSILAPLLAEVIFLTAFCLSRLQFRIGSLDFSSLAGRHEGTVQVVIGRLTLAVPDVFRGRQANFGVWPFVDGDYLYNIRPDRGMELLTTTVGGAITNPNMNDYIVRDTTGRPATVFCNSSGERFLHCEIDSARKWGGHIGAILGVIAVIIAALVFAPILAAIEPVCHVPFIGPALCFIIGAILGAIGAFVGGLIGGLIGDGIDALNDPRDDVLVGDVGHDEGTVLQVTGIHVTDLDHGHNELHPLTTLRAYTGAPEDDVKGAGRKRRQLVAAYGIVTYAEV